MSYSVEVAIPRHRASDEEYLRHMLHQGRRRMAEGLLEHLPHERWHVIRIREIWPDEYKYYMKYGLANDWHDPREPFYFRFVVDVHTAETEYVRIPKFDEIPWAARGTKLWKPFKWLNDQFKRVQEDIRNYRD
jgi:hypothetical protein